ncbi:Protein of unknown function [Bacillus wiedmannii]|uniref:Uncharacterized protein n=1 Tax=Bacillus wiedmannii TaxID=1890302 RepID=A0AB37Z3F2_9BACI|nr:Protein of unknown function [Bacillus wiedmannii]
MNQVLRKK